MTEDEPNLLNHPVQFSRGVERVFVGIPDILPADRLIRLQALQLAVQLLRLAKDDDTAILTTAARFAAFIADGTVPEETP